MPPCTDLTAAEAALASAGASGIGASLRKARLEKAIFHFNKALSQPGLSTEQRMQAQQGLQNTFTTLLKSQSRSGISPASLADVKHILTQLLDSVTTALNHKEFAQVLVSAVFEVIRADMTALSASARQSFLLWLEAGCKRLPRDPYRLAIRPALLEISLTVGEDIYHTALKDFLDGKWARALNLVRSHESAMVTAVDLESALNGETPITEQRARSLATDFDLLHATCQGSQLLKTGDMLWETAIKGDPDDFWGYATLAQDDYRRALSCTEERDLELEGTILTRIARFYAKVVKLPSTAHGLYLRAVQLATALSPTLPRGTWYAEAIAAVQKHRADLEAEEARQWSRVREPFVEKLRPELDELSAKKTEHGRDPWAFAVWVWKRWPPKTAGTQDLPDTEMPMRKRYLKVIQRYHSDKNQPETFGGEWAVMAEEIAKALNSFYNRMKGMD